MKNIRKVFNLHGLQAQVLLWTVLPLTILLIVFSLGGVSSHQQSMQELATEEHSRLVLALSELISVQRDNYALRNQVTLDQVPIDALDLDRILNVNHPDTISTVVVIDQDGQILFGKGELPSANDIRSWPGVSNVLAGENGVLFTPDPTSGDVVAYAPVPNSHWSLILREPWHSLTDPLFRFEQVMPFILLIATAISFLTLFFGLRSVVQPLRELRIRSSQIGQGNFTAAVQPVGGVKEIEDLRVTLNDMAIRIQSYQVALQDYARAVTQAQEEERGRLSRELHDETIQTLIALGHKAQMVQRTFTRDPEQVDTRINELRQMIQQAIEEVRRLSRALHPQYLEELGLVTALETLAREAGADFRVQGSPQRMKPEQELTFYRIAQEALNNALHHAEAKKIVVELLVEPVITTLRVCDNGEGFEFPAYFNSLTRSGHFGLIGMRERAELVDGQLKIVSAPGKGTTVTFSVTA